MIEKGTRTVETRCPYCNGRCTMDVVQNPLSHREHIITGCKHCLCVTVEDIDQDIHDTFSNDWYVLMAKLFEDAVRAEMDTEHYKTFLKDRENYKARTGRDMPVYEGICADYIRIEKAKQEESK